MKEKLQEVFRDTFSEKELALTNVRSKNDLASWNTIYNDVLISEIVASFNVKIVLSETLKIKNEGDIRSIIVENLSA